MSTHSGGKPLSKYAAKVAARLQGTLTLTKAVNRAAAVETVPEFPQSAKCSVFRTEHVPVSSRHNLRTMSYLGGGDAAVSLLGETYPAVSERDLQFKPCFFVAEQKDGFWWLTRFVGDSFQNGTFEGVAHSHLVGMATSFLQKSLVRELSGWMRAQDPSRITYEPHIFVQAQMVNPDADLKFAPNPTAKVPSNWYL